MVRQKSNEELAAQLSRATQFAVEELDLPKFSFPPPADSTTNTSHNTPVRYDTFKETLRALRSKENISEDSIDASSITLVEKLRFVDALNRLDRYVSASMQGHQNTLRDHQVDVFEDIRVCLENGLRSGYIKLPTGSGKTAIFCELAEVLGLKTLVVVPTKELISQTQEQMHKFATTIPKEEIGLWYGEKKDQIGQVTITTYDSMVAAHKNGTWSGESFQVVILDEAHLALGLKRRKSIESFMEKSLVIGVTATPEYDADKSLDTFLGERIHTLNVVPAIERGLLAPTVALPVCVTTDISGVKILANGNYDEAELEKAINIATLNDTAVQLYQQLFEDKKIIVNCASIGHAKEVALAMQKAGVRADFVFGDDPNREDKIARLKKGELQVVCNVNILIAGFDDPQVVGCINLAPTTSKVRAEQRGGRPMRLDPNDPTKHAVIVDVIYKDSRNAIVPVLYSDILEGRMVVGVASESNSVDRPQWLVKNLQNLSIEGVKVLLSVADVTSVTHRQQESNLATEIPEGWMHKTQMIRKYGVTSAKIDDLLEKLRIDNPEYIATVTKEILVKGRPILFYSPELQKIISDQISMIGMAPDGYVPVYILRDKYKMSPHVFQVLMSRVGADAHTALFKARSKSGTMHASVLHLSAGGVKIIEKALGEPPPQDWEKVSIDLEDTKPKDRLMAQAIIEVISAGSPHGYFIKLNKGQYTPTLYVSPEAAEKIERVYNENFTLTALVSELECSVDIVSEIADKIRANQPQLFRMKPRTILPGTNLTPQELRSSHTSQPEYSLTHLTPHGYVQLRDQVCNQLLPAEGWQSAVDIKNQLNTDDSIRQVEMKAEQLIRSAEFTQDDVREYKTERGHTKSHYSPDLCRAVINALQAR